MKKIFVPTFLGLLFLLTPVFAMGATFTGSIQGFLCVTQGHTCPLGKEDAMIATENVFVLLVDDKKGEYYFLSNVDRANLARHVNEQIKVNGELQKQHRSIKVTEMLDSKGKKFWYAGMEEDLRAEWLKQNPIW